MKPINLRECYGDCHRIVLDESAYCEEGGRKNPWYFQIPCKYGHFYPHSDWRIGFYCESAIIRHKLRRDHPEIEVRQWADDGEAVFLFKPEQFELVAEYAQPKRKRGLRKLSAEHKAKLVEAGRDHRFASDSTVNNGSSEAQKAHKTAILNTEVSEHG